MGSEINLHSITPNTARQHHIEDERPGYYFQVQNEVIDYLLPTIGVYGYAVYSYVLRAARGKDTCYPSQGRIAKTLGISRDSVIKAIALIKGLGLVSTEARHGDNGERRSDLIILHDAVAVARSLGLYPVCHTDTPVCHTDTPLSATPTPPVGHTDTEVNIRRVNNDRVNTPIAPKGGGRGKKDRGFATPEQQDRFERWWLAWPKKDDRQAAERAWIKLNPDDALTTQLILATEQQARAKEWDGKDPERRRFIPDPSTWLNGKRWADETGTTGTTGGAPKHGYFALEAAYLAEVPALAGWWRGEKADHEQNNNGAALASLDDAGMTDADLVSLIRFWRERRGTEPTPVDLMTYRAKWRTMGGK